MRRIGPLSTVAALALVVTLVPAPPPANAQQPGAITSVTAQASTVTITGTAPSPVDIYALSAAADPASYRDHQPAARAEVASDGSFSATVPRFDAGVDRLYAQYVAVAGDTPLGGPRFVDALDFPSAHQYPYPQAATKKGLQVEMTDDAEELGVAHAAINVVLDRIMRLGPGDDPDLVMPFVSNGRTFYFSVDEVLELDSQLKPLSDNGVLINLILILYRPRPEDPPNSAWPVLHHPNANLDAGTVFAFNTVTEEGVAYFTAAMEFLADRYTRPDGRFGRAVGFIVGNEVDAQWVWANAGEQTVDEFVAHYAKAVRIAWQATRKYWAGARTYISLTHCWTAVCGANPDPARPTHFYPGQSVVDRLNELTKGTGDVGWNIAHHPYPETADPVFWDDASALPGFDTPRITFRNIEVLPAYLSQEPLTYQGANRRIILSEQGCNTPGETEEAQRLQAACYAYAYYKIRFLAGIDAFILHRHVDHQDEGGLRLGLWTWDDAWTGIEPALPHERKASYDVFRYIDTVRSLEVTDFAKALIGIADWADVIPGFDPAALAQRDLPRQVGADPGDGTRHERTLASFDRGTDGWRPADNASDVARVAGGAGSASGAHHGKGFLRVGFAGSLPAWSTYAKTWKGADVVLPRPVDATRQAYLSLALRIPAPRPGQFHRGVSFHAQVRAYAADGSVAYGLYRLNAGRWTELTTDLSTWAGRSRLTRVKVWVSASDNVDWEGSFDLDSVRLARAAEPAAGRYNLDVALAGLAPLQPDSELTLSITNNSSRTVRRTVHLESCDGVTVSPDSVHLAGLAPLATRTVSLTVRAAQPADPERPVLCLRVGRTLLAEAIALRPPPPPVPTVLYDFDDATTQGWQAGSNVDSVVAVTSFLNGPGIPFHGTHALDAASRPAPASADRTAFVAPPTPLDLSPAKTFTLRFDSYGGSPARQYEVDVTLTGTDGTTADTTQAVRADTWNEVTIDVSGWAGRAAVARIAVTFRAPGWELPTWDPHFQVDYVGYYP